MAAMLTRRNCGLARGSPCLASGRSLQVPRILARAAATEKDKKVAIESPAHHVEVLPNVQPSTAQVQQFLRVLVTETNIMEMSLQVGDFELMVRRSTGGVAAAPAPQPAAAAAAPQTVIVQAKSPMETLMSMQESIDESMVPIFSPKVGVFRRGKYAGGKRLGKGMAVNVGDQVKKGQPLAFVEQLGTFVAVEAPQAGEVVAFFLEEGAAVEYKQEVLELAPFFGGHIIGEAKYA